jgi:hypothetical protein
MSFAQTVLSPRKNPAEFFRRPEALALGRVERSRNLAEAKSPVGAFEAFKALQLCPLVWFVHGDGVFHTYRHYMTMLPVGPSKDTSIGDRNFGNRLLPLHLKLRNQ